jgi:hypothetical protein
MTHLVNQHDSVIARPRRTGSSRLVGDPRRSEQGHALIEFSFVLPILIILVLCTIDFGHLIQTRLIITNVSREGGSIASRQIDIDNALANLLVASGSPLVLGGPDGRIVMSRIAAGLDENDPDPRIKAQISTGGLGVGARIDGSQSQLGLSQSLHDRLVFDPDQGAPDIAEVTVVEVYYKYRPITPLPNFLQGALLSDGDGIIIGSTATF